MFYHASKEKDLKIITPMGMYEREGITAPMVFLHTEPMFPHYTVMDITLFGWIYEVEPLGKVKYFSDHDEYFTLFPCVVKRIIRKFDYRTVKHPRRFTDNTYQRDERRRKNAEIAVGVRKTKRIWS